MHTLSPYSKVDPGSFLIYESVPENCKTGSFWGLHIHIQQIKFPLLILFSLQFIPRTIAKPIFLNHQFRHIFHCQAPSAVLNWPPHWPSGPAGLHPLSSRSMAHLSLTASRRTLALFGQASLLSAPSSLPFHLWVLRQLLFLTETPFTSSWAFSLQNPPLLFPSAFSFLSSEFL